MTARGLAEIADSNEIAAVSDWLAALKPGVAADHGARAQRFGGALALALPATGTLFFNRVIGLGAPSSRPAPWCGTWRTSTAISAPGSWSTSGETRARPS